VGPRASLDTVAKTRIPAAVGIRNPVVQTAALSLTDLPRLLNWLIMQNAPGPVHKVHRPVCVCVCSAASCEVSHVWRVNG